ncbi:carbon-nitrogen hydrolase family protein [Streptomyces olivaceoviridis]|uniref:carbon-nitrogen hydrolase family protein n=1 Tax=Streptomyces olivaceoviridis TaxID=1921 RepID=UPI00024BD7BE|nr:nitrilase/cyanide hydratase and apolipoprotein N-acyltransferase [Streptomyces hygroscopicus subsp. jinggangensis 5008]AGF67918.1 nitrilase/cyanide hydratase and apolipoprotein N-acyltransferase [Streptomyces hygroscopicus subsp. jinggangensis TL01]
MTLRRRLRVGLVQLSVATNRRTDNLRRAEALVHEAVDDGCELVVLPEAFATALNLPKSHEVAEPVPGPVTEWLAERASRHGVWIAAGLLERNGEHVHSSAVLIADDGSLVDVYRRTVVYDLEAHFLTGEVGTRVVDTPLGRIGLVVGYDIQFPEVLRGLFADGVEIVVCPSILLRPFAEPVRQMLLARAAENCAYVLFAGATGENTLAGLTYMGRTAVIRSPMAIGAYSRDFRRQEPVLAEADREECVVSADLDLHELRRMQAAAPFPADFRRSPLGQALIAASARPGALPLGDPR